MPISLALRLAFLRIEADGGFYRITAGHGFADYYWTWRPAHFRPVWSFRRTPGCIEVWAGRFEGCICWGREKAPVDALELATGD